MKRRLFTILSALSMLLADSNGVAEHPALSAATVDLARRACSADAVVRMALRGILHLELLLSTQQALDRISDRTGMQQVTVFSRLVEWFANQEPTIQCAIMGHFPPDIQVDIAKLILEQMANAQAGDAVK